MKEDTYLAIDVASYYEFYMLIHAEAHNILIYYGEAMVDNCKCRKFLDGIIFGPICS